MAPKYAPVKLKGKKIDAIPCVENAILETRNLHVSYKTDSSHALKQVIKNINVSVKKGETFALIGESGSGKSVLTSTFYGLPGENAVFPEGQIIVNGKEVQKWSNSKWEKSGLRGDFISVVFQNPMSSLNPTMKIGKQIMEGMLINNRVKTFAEAKARAIELLEKMRINDPKKVMDAYPHQLSGGMKQRIVIAAIVACEPEVIVMDEPTTALDPSVQAEVLKIIEDLQKEYNLTIVFITHDLGVVASIADRIGIMYAGQIVELGSRDDVIFRSAHPYTWGLLQSMPDLNRGARLSTIKGSVPTNLENIKGEAFAPRNDYAMPVDFNVEPPFFEIAEGHYVKSWLYDSKAPKVDVPAIIRKRWAKKGGLYGKK